MRKTNLLPIAAALLLGNVATGNATIVGFGQLGGSNTTVPANLASSATVDGLGYTVGNGTTPNVSLNWDANWDIHQSTFFNPLENTTAGGGNWDEAGTTPSIGQLDTGNHTIGFTVDPGFALVLNSFDFGHTAETPGTTSWTLTLTDSGNNTTVWQTTVDFTNGQTQTVTPGFTGTDGEDYVLTFNRTAQSYNSDGRHGIDNLSFNQVAVPEASTTGLMGLAVLGLLSRRRK